MTPCLEGCPLLWWTARTAHGMSIASIAEQTLGAFDRGDEPALLALWHRYVTSRVLNDAHFGGSATCADAEQPFALAAARGALARCASQPTPAPTHLPVTGRCALFCTLCWPPGGRSVVLSLWVDARSG